MSNIVEKGLAKITFFIRSMSNVYNDTPYLYIYKFNHNTDSFERRLNFMNHKLVYDFEL